MRLLQRSVSRQLRTLMHSILAIHKHSVVVFDPSLPLLQLPECDHRDVSREEAAAIEEVEHAQS